MSEYIATVEYGAFIRCDFAQEIVRCRNCAYYDRMNDDEGMCMMPDDNGDYARWMVDDVGYCYLGERRVDER